jgi:hypothetical protein
MAKPFGMIDIANKNPCHLKIPELSASAQKEG